MLTVIESLDLAVDKGEFCALIGPSGCGKSTLLRLIVGLEDASEGSVHINGRDPQVFLFDEPLSNLDALLRVQMRQELSNLHHDLAATKIYLTHDQIEVMTLADRIVLLNRGRIMQVETPLDPYERPANRFVAAFIGSPSMNFLACKVSAVTPDTVKLNPSGITLPRTDPRLSPGASVDLGIRPEHASLDPAGTLHGHLRLVEPLGNQTLVHLETQAGQMTVQGPGKLAIKIGDRPMIALDPDQCHLFDVGGDVH